MIEDMGDATIKKNDSSWKNGMAKNITFIVTKDCQLACKYCYLVGKNEKERMSWDVAKKAIDYISSIEKDELAILTLFLLRYHMPQKGEIK